MSRRTFVESCLDGRAMLTDVDDWVDKWHERDDGGKSLAEYLGMTDEEYSIWVERPESLRLIISAHSRGMRVTDLMMSKSRLMAAARADDSYEAIQVVHWLIQTGRIDAPES